MSRDQVEFMKIMGTTVLKGAGIILFSIIGFFSVKTYEKIERIEDMLNQMNNRIQRLELIDELRKVKNP